MSGHQERQDRGIRCRRSIRSVTAYCFHAYSRVHLSLALAVILFFVLYTKIKEWLASRREAREAQARELDEEDKKVQQMFDQEKNGASKDDDPSNVSSIPF